MSANPQRVPLVVLRDAVLFPTGRVSNEEFQGLTEGEKRQAQASAGLWVVVTTSIIGSSLSSQLVGGRGSGRPAIGTLAKLTLAEADGLSDEGGMLVGVARCLLIATQRSGNRATALIRPLVWPQPEAISMLLQTQLQAISQVWPKELAEALRLDHWSMLGAPIDQAEAICNIAQGFIRTSVAHKLVHLNTIDPVVRLRMTHHDLLQEMEERKLELDSISEEKLDRPRARRGTHLRLVPSTMGLG